jgi:hypothetical protein
MQSITDPVSASVPVIRIMLEHPRGAGVLYVALQTLLARIAHMTFPYKHSAGFAWIGHIRRVDQRYPSFAYPLGNLLDAKLHIFGELLDVQSFVRT